MYIYGMVTDKGSICINIAVGLHHKRDTDEVLEHRNVPNAVVISISRIICRAFLECFECHGVVYLVKKLTQYRYLKHSSLHIYSLTNISTGSVF